MASSVQPPTTSDIVHIKIDHRIYDGSVTFGWLFFPEYDDKKAAQERVRTPGRPLKWNIQLELHVEKEGFKNIGF